MYWIVFLGQYIGDPIDCWTPAEFSGQWTKYADQYCWVKNTYYVPMTKNIPDHAERSNLEITYYQWTPIILAFQALLFVIPGLLWKVLFTDWTSIFPLFQDVFWLCEILVEFWPGLGQGILIFCYYCLTRQMRRNNDPKTTVRWELNQQMPLLWQTAS